MWMAMNGNVLDMEKNRGWMRRSGKYRMSDEGKQRKKEKLRKAKAGGKEQTRCRSKAADNKYKNEWMGVAPSVEEEEADRRADFDGRGGRPWAGERLRSPHRM